MATEFEILPEHLRESLAVRFHSVLYGSKRLRGRAAVLRYVVEERIALYRRLVANYLRREAHPLVSPERKLRAAELRVEANRAIELMRGILPPAEG